jgi:two-component system chemotaxis response regulator CheY
LPETPNEVHNIGAGNATRDLAGCGVRLRLTPPFAARWDAHPAAPLAAKRLCSQNVLLEAGHDVICEAADGASAIDLFREFRLDLVTMDINMPELNGLQASEHIHAQFPTARIVMVTSISASEDIHHAARADAPVYLLKPFRKEEVIEAPEAALKKLPRRQLDRFAHAFHDLRQAEENLRRGLKIAPGSEEAMEARGLLIGVAQMRGSTGGCLPRFAQFKRSRPTLTALRGESADLCRSCYWGSPEGYAHIALESVRREVLIWKGTDIQQYERISKEARKAKLPVAEYIKTVLSKHS